MSFAASNSTPLYYWPLAIFLDEKGCILEGASGFKSKSYPSTILQHASIQGTFKGAASCTLYDVNSVIFLCRCSRTRVI